MGWNGSPVSRCSPGEGRVMYTVAGSKDTFTILSLHIRPNFRYAVLGMPTFFSYGILKHPVTFFHVNTSDSKLEKV
jgi:hypothetical protein